MKKISFILVLVIVLSLFGCDNRSQMEKDYDTVKSKVTNVFK